MASAIGACFDGMVGNEDTVLLWTVNVAEAKLESDKPASWYFVIDYDGSQRKEITSIAMNTSTPSFQYQLQFGEVKGFSLVTLKLFCRDAFEVGSTSEQVGVAQYNLERGTSEQQNTSSDEEGTWEPITDTDGHLVGQVRLVVSKQLISVDPEDEDGDDVDDAGCIAALEECCVS